MTKALVQPFRHLDSSATEDVLCPLLAARSSKHQCHWDCVRAYALVKNRTRDWEPSNEPCELAKRLVSLMRAVPLQHYFHSMASSLLQSAVDWI